MTVFPAHAGVIPLNDGRFLEGSSLSRTCGGDPASELIQEDAGMSFPHMRG